jgi:hypothetical protein
VARQNRIYINKLKGKPDGTNSQPTTVKTLDILRLINGVNKAAEKSKKLE